MASIITTSSIRLSLVGLQVDWMINTSLPRTFSLILYPATSPSEKRETVASPREMYRRSAIRCASSGVALPANSFISGTVETSGLRPVLNRLGLAVWYLASVSLSGETFRPLGDKR